MKCKQCGNEMEAVYVSRKKFCSDKCRRKFASGVKNADYYDKCKNPDCNEQIPRREGVQSTYRKKYCSRECRDVGRSLSLSAFHDSNTFVNNDKDHPCRTGYCRSGTECRNYDDCLDKALEGIDWKRASGAECYEPKEIVYSSYKSIDMAA